MPEDMDKRLLRAAESVLVAYDSSGATYESLRPAINTLRAVVSDQTGTMRRYARMQPLPAWGLSPVESRIAAALAAHNRVSAATLSRIVYAGKDMRSVSNPLRNIYVFVHRMRKKLEPFGIRIERAYSGYYVTEDTAHVLRAGFGMGAGDDG